MLSGDRAIRQRWWVLVSLCISDRAMVSSSASRSTSDHRSALNSPRRGAGGHRDPEQAAPVGVLLSGPGQEPWPVSGSAGRGQARRLHAAELPS
jgi:hypothetical protein